MYSLISPISSSESIQIFQYKLSNPSIGSSNPINRVYQSCQWRSRQPVPSDVVTTRIHRNHDCINILKTETFAAKNICFVYIFIEIMICACVLKNNFGKRHVFVIVLLMKAWFAIFAQQKNACHKYVNNKRIVHV